MMLSTEDKRDIARRLYDEGTTPGRECGQACFLDGLWFGLSCCGAMDFDEWMKVEDELWTLVDGLIEGSWE